MADFELLGLNESAPDARAPGASDRGTIVGGLRVAGLVELDGGADINGDSLATVSRTNPLRRAVRVAMTAATSGSNGIQALNNANLNFGTGNFTLHWEGSLSSAALADPASQRLIGKYQDVDNRYQFAYTPVTQSLDFLLRKTSGTSVTASLPYALSNIAAGTTYKWTCVVTRETALAAGSVVFYRDGVALGTVSIPAGTPANIDNTGSFQICGTPVSTPSRVASETQQAILYNRALTAAEVLSLSINGPALADIGASQTALTSGTLVVGRRYRIDTYVAGDSFTNVGAASNASGVEFVATGTTPTTWTNSSSLRRIGITGQWNAEDAQSNTGQIFDSSGNKNHALLPAAGATVIGAPVSRQRQVRHTNTWAETQELQYIGGANQNILPANARITSIVGVVTSTGGSGPQDIIIGDGSDGDRYVTLTTGLTTGKKVFTIDATYNGFTDGTNLKLTVDPDANTTMAIAWTITYEVTE